jgi:trimeric autotransporter adhesin
MGKVIQKKIQGMSLWAKISLVTTLTLLVSVFMYQGWYKPQQANAAVTTSNAWVNLLTNTSPANVSYTTTTTNTFTVTGNANRATLVGVALETAAATTISSITVRLDSAAGTQFIEVDRTTGSQREHCYIGSLVNVPAGTHTIYLTVTMAGSTLTGVHIDAGTYQGVDQTTPVTSSAANNSASAVVTFGTAVTYNANSVTAFITSAGNTGTGIALPAGFTEVVGAQSWDTDQSTSIAEATNSTAGSYVLGSTVTWTGSSARSAIAVAALNPAPTGDTTKPTVTTFTVPATSSSLTISGITFTASDNVGVTGYLINESATPPSAAAITLGSAPTSYTAASVGAKILYAWVKDAAGNVSNVFTNQNCTIALTDAIKPSVTAFTVPATSSSLTISGITFTASDNVGVTGYLINESSTPPAAAAITLGSAPTSYTAATAGAKTLYAWVKDAAGNVSDVFTGRASTITISDATKPTVTAFTVPATSSSLTISGITFTASDNVGVTGYLINESATPPAAAAITLGTAPTSYTAATAGAKTLYSWVRDAAGNVSNVFTSQTSTITLSTNSLMHSSASLNSTKYGTWGASYTCETCHNKNTTNVKRIAQQVNTPTGLRTVTFTRMTASTTNNAAVGVFGNDNRTYALNASTNICSVCHHKTTYHQYSSSKVLAGNKNHMGANNTDCTACHFHNAGFKGSGGHTTPYPGVTHMVGLTAGSYDSCTGCHSAPSGPFPAVSGAPACTSCHLDAANFNSASAGCADCHGTNVNGGRPTGTTFPDIAGSHIASGHVSLACASCHNLAGTGTADHGSQNRTAKVRADVTVAFPVAGAWNGSVALTCSATYCHSTVQNVTGSAAGVSDTTPAWGSGAANCTTNCHGNTGTRLTTGNHVKHLAATHGTYTCDNCHTGSGQSTPALHANSIINVQQNALLGSTGTYTQAAGAPGNGFGTCAVSYCHSTVQSATGGTAPTYRTPAWGGLVLTCAGCHGNTAATLTTGSHAVHLNAAYAYVCSDCHGTGGGAGNSAIHANQSINVDLTTRGSGTYSGDAIPQNSNFGSCSNTTCHGANSAIWGVANANATCATCHGVVGTSPAAYTADTETAAPGYNGTGVNSAGTVGTISGGVSNNTKVGAHDVHLKGTGGYKTGGVACVDCHSVAAIADPGHMNGSTTLTWSPLATNSGALTPGYTAPTCTANYCHGASFAVAVRGTGLSPSWIDGTYLANAASVKNALDCNKCHTSPPTASVAFDHSAAGMPAGLATDCASCHPHDGSGAEHMDGTLQGGGGCNGCHDYDTVGATYAASKWTGGTWGKASRDGLTPNEGWGAHDKHINYIKSRLSIATALDPVSQTYGVGVPANVCGTCHTNLASNHTIAGSTARSINFGDNTFRMGGVAGTSLLFGSTNPAYAGVSGISSAATAKTCSNLSCHYFTTPVWSTY